MSNFRPSSQDEWLSLQRPSIYDLNETFSGLGKILIEGDSFVAFLMETISGRHTDRSEELNWSSLAIIYELEMLISSLQVINSEEVCFFFFDSWKTLRSENFFVLAARSLVRQQLARLSKGSIAIAVRSFASPGDLDWRNFLSSTKVAFVLSGDASVEKNRSLEVSFLRHLLNRGITVVLLNRFFEYGCGATVSGHVVSAVRIQEQFSEDAALVAAVEHEVSERVGISSSDALLKCASDFKSLTPAIELFLKCRNGALPLLSRCFTLAEPIPLEVQEFCSRFLVAYVASEKFEFTDESILDVFDVRLVAKIFEYLGGKSFIQDTTVDNLIVIESEGTFARFLKSRNQNLAALSTIDYTEAVKASIISVPLQEISLLNLFTPKHREIMLHNQEEEERAPADDRRAQMKEKRRTQQHAAFLKRYSESLEGSRGLHHAIVVAVPGASTTQKSTNKSAQKIIEANRVKQLAAQLEKDEVTLRTLLETVKSIRTSVRDQIGYLDSVSHTINRLMPQLRWRPAQERLILLQTAWRETVYDVAYDSVLSDYSQLAALIFSCIDFLKSFASDTPQRAPLATILEFPVSLLLRYGFSTVLRNLAPSFPDHAAILKACDTFRNLEKPSFRYSGNCLSFQLQWGGPWLPRTLGGGKDPRVLFKPDAWQIQLLDLVDRKESAFICAPTASGKTFISYYAMERVLRESDDGVVVFVAPTKPLINQVYAEVTARFGGKAYSANSSCVLAGVFASDYAENPFNCQVLVTVPQLLYLLLTASDLYAWRKRIKYAILDEIHLINDGAEYGRSWEHCITSLTCPILAMSATVENKDAVYSWVQKVSSKHGIPCHLIQHSERYSDLKKFFFSPNCQPSLQHLHPMATLLHQDVATKGITEDLLFLPEESHLLWESLVDKFPSNDKLQSLAPNRYFAEGQLLCKADCRKWEVRVKEAFVALVQSGVIDEKIFDQIQRKCCGGRNAVQLAAELSDCSNATGLEESEAMLLKNFPLLVKELSQRGMLPALFFYVERRDFCNTLALALTDHLKRLQKEADEATYHVDKMRLAANERIQKAARKARDLEVKVNKDSWIDDALAEEELQASLTSEDDVDPKFSYVDSRGKVGRKELDEICDELRWRMAPTQVPLLAALRRGIGVHHTGLPRKYLRYVEFLFRRKHLQVVVSTSTLALGINMPCKSAVFCGDSLQLTSTAFRQMSGRAGRRGFDDVGYVVFYEMPPEKLNKLQSSRLPRIVGASGGPSIGCGQSLLLAMQTAAADACEHSSSVADRVPELQRILKAASLELELPLSSIAIGGADTWELWATIRTRLQIDAMLRTAVLDSDLHPTALARFLIPLVAHFDPVQFVLLSTVLDDSFRKFVEHLVANAPGGATDSSVIEAVLSVFCHISERVSIPIGFACSFRSEQESFNFFTERKHRSLVLLPPLPPIISKKLAVLRAEAINLFKSAASFAMQDANRPKTTDFALSGDLLQGTAPQEMEAFFAKESRQFPYIAPVLATTSRSAHDDVMNISPSSTLPLHRSLNAFNRSLIAAGENVQPHLSMCNCLPTDWNTPANAYILDYYRHGHVPTIEAVNGVSEGKLWQHLHSFTAMLSQMRRFLMSISKTQLLNPAIVDVVGKLSEQLDSKYKEMFA